MARPFLPAALALGLCGGSGAAEPPPPSPPPPPPSAHAGDAATGFARDDLRALPRPANPWALLREVPGVALDRVDVGGSETGLQSLVVAGGDQGGGTVFTLDGIDVTDPAAPGALAFFPDLDAVEGVLVRTRAVDVRVRTPGARVDLSLRAPPAGFSGGLHLRGSGRALQSDNLPSGLRGRPFFRNDTERLTELGAEAGGARGNGTLAWWGAVSRHELRQRSFTEHDETLRVTNVTAKTRWHGRAGALSALALRSEKVHEGRDTGLTTLPSARWRQSGPSHVLSLEGRRPGGLDTVARVSYLDGGFRLDAEGGPRANAFEDFRGVLQGSYYAFETERRRFQAQVETRAERRALGFTHAFLAGAGYRRSRVDTRLGWPGNQVLALERQNVFFRAFGLTGFALPTRAQAARTAHDHFEAYVQDSLRRGRFGLTLGLRFDRQQGRNLASSVAANPVVPELLPAVSFPGTPPRFTWRDVLPRASLSFDLDRAARRVARVSYAEYGASLGSGDVAFDNPVGREAASLTYYWLDRNGDHAVQADELDLLRGRLASAGLDPRQPGSALSPHAIDPAYRSPHTRELAGSVEADLGLGLRALVRASWRRLHDARWTPLRDLTLADYEIRGAVQGTLFGDLYSVGFYAPASESRIVPGAGRRLTNRAGYRQESGSVEAVLSGRAGTRVRWTAWGAWFDWREYFEDVARAVQDPTPLDVEPLQDAGRVAVRAGGLGRGDLFVHARWNAGAAVEARLPARFESALTLHARDGFPIPYFQVASSGDPTGGSKNVLVASRVDAHRLPAVALLDARLARGFALGRGRLTASADAFNLLNRGAALQVSRDVELPVFGRPRELLRPRLLRLGLAYSF